MAKYITIGRYTYGPDDERPSQSHSAVEVGEKDEAKPSDTDKATEQPAEPEQAPPRAKSRKH